MVAVRFDPDGPYVSGRIIVSQAELNCVPHHDPQRHAQRVSGSRSIGVGRHQPDDMFAPQERSALVTMLPAEPLDGPTVGPLRRLPQRAKFGRGEVAQGYCLHGPRAGPVDAHGQRLLCHGRFVVAHKLGRVGQAP
jgi:hypothetical protein